MNSGSKVTGLMKILVAVGALTISGIIVYYVISGVITLVPKRETYDWTKMRFFEQLDTEISLGTLRDVKDIERVRDGIARSLESTQLRSDDLESLLKEYSVQTRWDEESDDTTQRERIQTVNGLIEAVAARGPFSVLPEGDELTAMQLENSIELGDRDTALARLRILTTSLGRQISSLRGQVESNRQWVILGLLATIAGILVTVVVYLLSRRAALSRRFDEITRYIAAK